MMTRFRAAVRGVALLLCAALLAGLCGCGEDEGVRLGEGATFTIAVSQRPDTLNPVSSAGGLTEEFFLLCYDPLWRLDAQGEPQPALAEDWGVSSDQLTWTIRLRRDATFSDGVAVTSRDVQFSYELMRQSKLYAAYLDGVNAIRCPDDYTVVISTDYVKGDMQYNPAPILPRHIWIDHEFDPGAYENAAMVGSGPFVYMPEERGEDGWVFRSRMDYAGETAKIGAVFFSYYGTVTGAARAVQSGTADASFGLSDVQLTTLAAVPNVDLLEAVLPMAECRAVVFNLREDSVFSSPGVRRTVEYCANRAYFLSMSAGGAGMTGSSFVSPGTSYFTNVSSLRGYDTAAGRNEILVSGYSDNDRDGVLENFALGTTLSVTLFTSNEDDWASTAATILMNDLESIGFVVNWRKTDGPVKDVCGGKGGWDLCMYSWRGNPSAATAAGEFRGIMESMAGWTDGSYDSALTQLRTTFEETTTRATAQRLQQLVYDECAVVVLSYSADIQAVHSDTWTGYSDIIAASGALFGIGSADVYMQIERVDSVG